MTTINLSELIAQAEAAGADFKAVHVPKDQYKVRVTHNNYKQSKAGNPGFGVRTEIIEGPYAGKGFWSNFYLTPLKNNGEANTAGVAIFFRGLAALGVATDEFKSGQTTVEQVIASNRLIGAVALADVEDDNFNPDELKSKVKNFKKAPQVASAGAPPAAPAPAPLPPAAFPPPAPVVQAPEVQFVPAEEPF